MKLHPKHSLLRNTSMDENFDKIVNSIPDQPPPKQLMGAVFQRIEKEKRKKLARKVLYFRLSFVFFGMLSFLSALIFGKEILASEFFSIAQLAFSDLKIIGVLWQDYAYSLLETLPAATLVATLLPIFVFMELLRQYGKLEKRSYFLKH